MNKQVIGVRFTGWQQFFLALLRIAIGWHFLREGIVKLMEPGWTAYGYLMGSWGPFSDIFHWMAGEEWMMSIINISMPWMLTIAGAGLILGLFTRTCSAIAMALLAMFYLAAPPFELPPPDTWGPFFSSTQNALWAGGKAIGAEGNYIIVNKNLIEFIAVAALWACDTGRFAGLDILLRPAEESQPAKVVPVTSEENTQAA